MAPKLGWIFAVSRPSRNIEVVPTAPVLSFPKIISGHIGGAVQPGSEWQQWRQTVGLLDARAHLSLMPRRARLIVIRRIGGKNSPQVRLAEDEHSIQALAAQCAYQPFSTAILPWRSRRDRSVADTHHPHPRREDVSIGVVVVAHQIG